MRPYPLMVDLEGKPVLVIGGGVVASRKVEGLLAAGAQVVVISPDILPELQRMHDAGEIRWVQERFDESRLDRYPDTALIFGATDDRDVGVRIYEAARKRGIPCNIADVPDLCTFYVPAVVSVGDLMIAISTGGSSPALARRIRESLEMQYGPEYGKITAIMAEIRKQALSHSRSTAENKKLFMSVVDSGLLAALKADDPEEVQRVLGDVLPDWMDLQRVLAAVNRE